MGSHEGFPVTLMVAEMFLTSEKARAYRYNGID